MRVYIRTCIRDVFIVIISTYLNTYSSAVRPNMFKTADGLENIAKTYEWSFVGFDVNRKTKHNIDY